jgi:hypothetical protein
MVDRRRRLTTGHGEDGDRAVSDVVAFVFTFSIIITSVGVVSGVGFSVMEDVRDDEQALNAQRSFQTLGENLNQIDRGGVPGRAGEISLNGGLVLVESGSEGPTFEVVTDGDTFTSKTGRIVYQSGGGDTEILLEAGGVIRKDERSDRGFVVQRPNIVCGSEYAIVSIVKIVGDADTVAGDSTVQIRGREQSSTLLYSDDDATSVTVDYSGSQFDESWNGHFDREGDWDVDTLANTAECDVGSDGHVIVRRTVIEITVVN